MKKILAWKFALIAVVSALVILQLYPPEKTLKPGIDLAGGTSLIYEIDAQGLGEADKKELAQRMITVLRRRIDPANIQNLVWRPQGNTRFEIQMPLASAEARQMRRDFEKTMDELLNQNINTAKIMRSLEKLPAERTEDFNDFASGSEQRKQILDDLAQTYDRRKDLREQSNRLAEKLKEPENQIEAAGLDLDEIQSMVGLWITLDDIKLKEALRDDPGFEENLELLTGYTNIYSQWAEVTELLTNTETGANVLYRDAKRQLAKLSLTEEQIKAVLDMPEKSTKRLQSIEELKAEFADRAELIDGVIAAFDEYRPFQGRLDDPKDLQRMLKGAGILEFRILPTAGQPNSDSDLMEIYIQNLKEKGPKYASDSKYVWCEIEDHTQWNAADSDERPSVAAKFADKYYVLASNKQDEVMLHSTDRKQWKLKNARPTQDQQGRRAIGFALDDRAGKIFGKITGNNMNRPLCILLDGIAISAPNIQARITTSGVITGSFTQDEIADMVNKLNAGSLPARLIEQPISLKTIGPSIGADNRDQGVSAGFIGLVVVVACMLVYYLLAGGIADIALVLNILLILAAMAMLRATFTLPGIAGLILTIGMSVDANVLIFERIREEQLKGSSLRIAIKNGYQKAFRTIFDANLTTFITAAILFWVAPEEVKGFAIVLMLGILSSMFTALFVTRTIFDLLLQMRVLKDHVSMCSFIRIPNINWMALRPVFLTTSTLLIAAGLFVFFTRDNTKNNKYDIEFTGGTSVQINLKEPVHIQLIRDRIQKVGADLNNPAIAAANVYSVGQFDKKDLQRQYEINTTETNKTKVTISFGTNNPHTIESITAEIKTAENKIVGKLSNLLIIEDSQNNNSFVILTSQLNKSIVKEILVTAFPDAELSEPELDEVVNKAVITAFADLLEIQQNLQPEIVSSEKITEELVDASGELIDFLGGVKITCQINKAATGEQIKLRFKDLRFKPDMRNLNWYRYKIFAPELKELPDDLSTVTFIYASAEPEAGYRELTEDEWGRFVENETTKILAAARLEESLPRVTQINPSVGAEAKTQAMIAIVLSLSAIIAYIWIRFGNVRYGLAAIAALVHDVCITLGAVTACTYIASTTIGETLLIGDFKINQVIIAAFLTLIGYSLNDTIVIFDRIRENRQKARLTPKTITNSINQTIPRTILTSLTTFAVVFIMYIFGGQNLRGFTFAIGLGIIIGTYSSIAIAAPLLLLGTKTEANGKKGL